MAVASYDKIRRGAELGKPLTASDFVESTAMVNHYYFYGVDEDFVFEEVIRENLDIGPPSQVSLVFDSKVNRRTPGAGSAPALKA